MKMRFNEAIAEKPAHGHYGACQVRMTGIEQFSKYAAYYAIGSSAYMAVTAMFTETFQVISWLPMLIFGNQYGVGYLFLQFLELLAVAALGFKGNHKADKCHIILFGLYALMAASALICGFTERGTDTTSLMIGVGGLIVLRNTFRNVADYEQLKETEGFPQFSEIIARSDDNPGYTSRYMAEYSRQSEETGDGRQMHELETISTADAIPDEIEFTPDSGDDDMFDPL